MRDGWSLRFIRGTVAAMDLNQLLVFSRVVEAGSFTAAAKALGMPKSTVSRRVMELEERLGARLLQRTTRRLALTDVGRTYFEACERIVAEAEEAERAVSSLKATPSGPLRVSAPLNFAFLGPTIADYLQRYPEVKLELTCTDRVVDLVEERFDLAIRAGPLSDSSLIARALGSAQRELVASPAWLKQHKAPKRPEDLRDAPWLFFGAGVLQPRVKLERERELVELRVQPRMLVNDMDLLRCALTGGLGVGLVPSFSCVSELADGTLVRLLPGWSAGVTPIHAVYPSTRHLSPKVKLFIDHLQAELAKQRWARK